MRRARSPEALLDVRREVATLTQHHRQKNRVIGGRKDSTHASAQALAPLFKRTVEVEACWPMLQAQTLWIAHASYHINALPTHEALKVEATWVV